MSFAAALAVVVVCRSIESRADDCPRMLEAMQASIETGPNGLFRRTALILTETRAVEVEYAHSYSFADQIVDLGLGSMQNLSSETRRLRYHHELPLDRAPLMLLGEVRFQATQPADFDLRIGCQSLEQGADYHVVDGGGDRVRLRVEAVLAPGERIVFWWSADLEIVVAGRLPHDRDDDGDLDVDDLVLALQALGRSHHVDEIESLRSLVQALGVEGTSESIDGR